MMWNLCSKQIMLNFSDLSNQFSFIEDEKEFCIRVCFNFFSTQKQVPQMVIGQAQLKYPFKALLLVI